MNTRLTGAQINQVYVSMGRAVDGRRGFDLGGTVDFTWGSDAYIVQAAGMEYNTGSGDRVVNGMGGTGRWGKGDYFAAFPQAYLEAAFGRWNVIAGKYYAPFGSSPYKSTENFFYSWASTARIAPHTGTGAYATYKVSDRLSVIGGWVMPEEFGESSDNNALIGGFVFTPGKRLNVRYAFAVGEDKYGLGTYRENDGYEKYFVHSLVTTTQLTHRLKYVFDWTYNQTKYYDIANGAFDGGAYRYGLNNELIFQANKRWAFGTRFGMLTLGKEATDWYTVAVGANWTPNKWLTVKPEVRYDWMANYDDSDPRMFNRAPGGGTRSTYQTSGGLSAVVKF
jgi:hypothetical protein